MEGNKFGYDKSRYTYVGDKLINDKGQSVMMGWERPIMKRVSEIITRKGGDILNIGFGMGIVDTYIQETSPKSHTIIESHPDVQSKMINDGWDKKENVTLHFDNWQKIIAQIGQFDGIYLDTWYDDTVPYIKPLLDHCLKVGGTFSMWYNYQEHMDILKTLDENYIREYVELDNDGLIPSAKEQYENGGYYIDPNRPNIIIPVIKRIS
jgi:hypothetical protein